MCDLAKERSRIDAILEWATIQKPVRDCVDESKLTDFGLAVLREHYADACSDECMRERCKDFAQRLAQRRKEGGATLRGADMVPSPRGPSA